MTKQNNKHLIRYIKRRQKRDSKDKSKKIVEVKKAGVMFAAPIGDEIIIGYSLCHKNLDKFDYVKDQNGLKKIKGFGLNMSMMRAKKWKEFSTTFICSAPQPKDEERIPDCVYIPQSIAKDLRQFILRCSKYYKEKNMPQWAKNYISK